MCSTFEGMNENTSNFAGKLLYLKYLDMPKKRRSYSRKEKRDILFHYNEELNVNGVGAVKRTAHARKISEACLSRWIKDEGLLNIANGKDDIKKLGSGRKKKYPQIEEFLESWTLEQENQEKPCTPMLAALAIAKKFKKHPEFEKFKGVNGMIFLNIRSPL